MPAFIRTVIMACIVMLCASSASARPFCRSATAERVREGIFNADFGYHLAISFAPFAILIGTLFVIYVTETANHLVWDLAFLASGVVMIIAGWLIIGSRGSDAKLQTKIAEPH